MRIHTLCKFERFILIDDNEDDNFFHEIVIRRAGFKGEILVFESGMDALDFFELDGMSIPTFVFLDINMPMMDGFEVARRATHSLANKPNAVLSMLTSSDSPADRQRAQTLTIIKNYIIKPLDAPSLLEIMKSNI